MEAAGTLGDRVAQRDHLGDGSVEAVFEGSGGAVNRMVEWCHHGPRGANVRDVTVVLETPTGVDDFRISFSA